MTEQLRVKCSHSIRGVCNFNRVTACNGDIEVCIYRKENKEKLKLVVDYEEYAYIVYFRSF